MKAAANVVLFALIFLSWPLGWVLAVAGAPQWLVVSLCLAPVATLAAALVAMFWSDQLRAVGTARYRLVKATAITAWKILYGAVAVVVVWSGISLLMAVIGGVIIAILAIFWPILEPIVSALFREIPWLGYVLAFAAGVWLGKNIYDKPGVVQQRPSNAIRGG